MKLYTAYDRDHGEIAKAVPWQHTWDDPQVAKDINRIEVEGRAEEHYRWDGAEWVLGASAVSP